MGVIPLEVFGSDQLTMTSLASEFARSGWYVFTIDFSGHRRSPGTLTFDNAQTDRLAYQALSALEEFKPPPSTMIRIYGFSSIFMSSS